MNERAGEWIAALAVIAILSLLWRENRFYRLGEHILLGLSIGFVTAMTVIDILIPKWYVPWRESVQIGDAGGIVFGVCALTLGLFWYGLYFKKTEWLMRLVLGAVLGASAGQALKNNFTQQMPVVASSFRSPIVISEGSAWTSLGLSISNTLFIVALITVLLYFFFSFEQRSSFMRGAARIGRFWLMVGFGVYFGNTIMTRLSVLIERVWFVVNDFFGKMFS